MGGSLNRQVETTKVPMVDPSGHVRDCELSHRMPHEYRGNFGVYRKVRTSRMDFPNDDGLGFCAGSIEPNLDATVRQAKARTHHYPRTTKDLTDKSR